jgi:NAD(P)H-dependent FMN reductase
MLYRFKSKNAGDVIMLEPNGKRVLEIIGKEPGPKGIVLVEQMPQAMVALQAAVAQEELEFAQARAAFDAGQTRETPEGEGVSLRQRVQPFIDMLRVSHQHGDPVVWGV